MCSNFLLLLQSLGSFRISFVYVYVNFSIDVCVYFVPSPKLMVKNVRFSTPHPLTRTPLVSTSSSSSLFSLSFYVNFSNMLPTTFCTVSESDALFCAFARGCLFSSDLMSLFS